MSTTILGVRPDKDQEAILQELPPVSPPQDGGAVAWLQCAGAFCLFFNSWGLVNTFGSLRLPHISLSLTRVLILSGVFQAYYEISMLDDVTPSSISWIGSLQAFLFVSGGVLTGPLYDRGHLRALVRTGSVLVVLGLVITSVCNKYWQFMLVQGLLTGLGNAMFFVPSMALLPTYFARRRALSMGIAITGGNLGTFLHCLFTTTTRCVENLADSKLSKGGIVYSVVFRQLQPKIGFGWAMRTIALIMLTTLILPVTCLKMRFKSPVARRFFDPQPWTEAPFVVFAVACLFGLIGLYIPYFYVDSFAREKELADASLALYLLPIMNAGSFAGRVVSAV